MVAKRNIYVYMDWHEFVQPIFMGTLQSEMVRGKEVFYFENDPQWLKYSQFRNIDPDLTAFTGKQFLPPGKQNFGIFLDSSPDRWGRTLLQRKEAIVARNEGRTPRHLWETDYLMGIYDGNRMGALRFKFSKDGDFMDNNPHMATPPWTSLRELEHASWQIELEEPNKSEYIHWLNMLIAPGSSLGGARPKANIVSNDNHLWMAKFPSKNDTKDMGAWEFVTYLMAKECGIVMSDSKMQRFNQPHHTFITKRFDRNEKGHRIHFASAMTLLGYADDLSHTPNASYLEMVEWIIAHCENTNANLEQLWRRIVFNIAVSNCDDHLRNHGFILNRNGWQLSPAYDINPDEYGTGLSLNISENDNTLDFELALSVAPYFNIQINKANGILNEIKRVVSSWQSYATKFGIPKLQQDQVANAFKY